MDAGVSDTEDTLPSVTGEASTREDEPVITTAQPIHPFIHVVIVAIIGALAVLAWLIVFEVGIKVLWENEFVVANPWMFPVICLPLSLLVGLLVKYRNAPTSIDESLLDSLSGDVSKIDWRRLPIAIVMPLVSLWSGAVLGPEGGIGGIGTKIAALYSEKVGIPVQHREHLVFSTLASAYNGMLANPLFTGVLGSELMPDPEARARTLPANLIGGSIGYLIFFSIGVTGLQDYFHLSPSQPFAPIDVVLVGLFGLVGLVLALITGAFFRVATALFGRFEGREVERALVSGIAFSIVGMVAPIVLFSGETQVQTVAADPARYGPLLLLVMAIVKLALLAVAFRSGFLGGPTFPAIFSAVCVALAISLVFPGMRVDVLIGGVMAGFLVVLFKAPFMTILLTVVTLQANAELTALIILAVATVMIVQPYLMAAITARQAGRSSHEGSERSLGEDPPA
jgi:H+/Cl- antiporter ClcA